MKLTKQDIKKYGTLKEQKFLEGFWNDIGEEFGDMTRGITRPFSKHKGGPYDSKEGETFHELIQLIKEKYDNYEELIDMIWTFRDRKAFKILGGEWVHVASCLKEKLELIDEITPKELYKEIDHC